MNITEIKRRNKAAGQHWFSPDTMRFFASRVLPTVYGDRYFITSEKRGFSDDSGRAYSVRIAEDDGGIETVGDFGGHASAADARRAIRQIIRDATPVVDAP